MRNLHIQSTGKFIESYINFVNKHFNPESHLFAVVASIEDPKFNSIYKNVHYIYKNFSSLLSLIKYMYKSNRIFLHGLFDKRIVLILFLQPWLLKKCYWIVWGGDLYKYRQPKMTLKKKIIEVIRKFVIKNMFELLPVVEGDFKLAQKWYKTKARYRYNAVYVKNLDPINKLNLKANEQGYNEVRLLIGNSATFTNNHEEIFEKLSRFKSKNIRLFAPLSYGDEVYAEKIIHKGKQFFGEKFVPLTKFMNEIDYINLLNSMHAGIFNNNRQQAMGNIYLLLYLGKKVFLRNDTSMWEELKNKYYIFPIKDINYSDFEFLYKLDKKAQEHNIAKVSWRYDEEKVKEVWEKIFND